LHLLWDKYPMIPTNNEASGIDRAHWLTHYPNDTNVSGPDRTVDFLFYSPRIKRVEARVRQDDIAHLRSLAGDRPVPAAGGALAPDSRPTPPLWEPARSHKERASMHLFQVVMQQAENLAFHVNERVFHDHVQRAGARSARRESA
jgi:hypothetical protein